MWLNFILLRLRLVQKNNCYRIEGNGDVSTDVFLTVIAAVIWLSRTRDRLRAPFFPVNPTTANALKTREARSSDRLDDIEITRRRTDPINARIKQSFFFFSRPQLNYYGDRELTRIRAVNGAHRWSDCVLLCK